MKNYTVKSLIEALLDPSFGIRGVILTNEDNRPLVQGKKDVKASSPKLFTPTPRPSTKIDPGQSIASIIDQHTRRLGITWWMTASGAIFIGKPNYDQPAAYHFQVAAAGKPEAQDNNVESATLTRSMDGRASIVQVNGQGIPRKGQAFARSSAGPKFVATAQDPDLVARGIVRKQIVADCDVLNKAEAQHRADIEQGFRRLTGTVIKLTVPGFRSSDGTIYAVDTLATVRIDEVGVNGTYYVTQRRFVEDRGKRRTELTLHEKGVWLA